MPPRKYGCFDGDQRQHLLGLLFGPPPLADSFFGQCLYFLTSTHPPPPTTTSDSSCGTLKLAGQFIPNPVVQPLHECHPVEAGVLKMHVVAVAGGRLSNPASATPIQVSRKVPVSLGLLQ
jgi:hypothetical protein